MNNFKIVCPCLFGLESEVAFELKKLDFSDVASENGRVSFMGNMEDVAKANISLRCAERVLISLGSFKALSFEELFNEVVKLPFEQFIAKDEAFPVKGFSINSTLHSVPSCQSIIKKAVSKRLLQKHGCAILPETAEKVQIQFSILKDEVNIMLDTSGPALHKRGYRQNSLIAPIRETLASGIIAFARVRNNSILYDPFCGSGTFLIEAAMRALNIAPGLKRRFACEKWKSTDKLLFKRARQEALAKVDKTVDFLAYGYDIDPEAVELTKQNAKIAGVDEVIKVRTQDISDFHIPDNKATVISNPPYGERLLELDEARKIYQTMSNVFDFSSPHNYYIITADDEFESIINKKADKRRKLYNGMLKCQLYMYFR